MLGLETRVTRGYFRVSLGPKYTRKPKLLKACFGTFGKKLYFSIGPIWEYHFPRDLRIIFRNDTKPNAGTWPQIMNENPEFLERFIEVLTG